MTMVERMVDMMKLAMPYWETVGLTENELRLTSIALLHAMRQPTQTMLDADIGGHWDSACETVVWEAMINAAIDEARPQTIELSAQDPHSWDIPPEIDVELERMGISTHQP